ncbi:MAG: sigma-70 family RNA polymerase sigma factor [Candidatus Aminicenantes bacterium]|nr:MAG: sigma-70 family RNA polymerase sigma factor [Candidatus Aminicenantes bacterium]
MDIDEIIDKYYQKIYKLCLFYLNNKEEAEEILQEIFIKVMKKGSAFKGKSGIYTWIYRIAVNTLINYINRKKIVEFISFESVKNFGEPGDDADSSLHGMDPAVKLEKHEIEKQKIEKLEECIQRLSHREKTAFYFFHYDRLKQSEIAGIMKTSVSAVESLVHKAVKKLKTCVKDT